MTVNTYQTSLNIGVKLSLDRFSCKSFILFAGRTMPSGSGGISKTLKDPFLDAAALVNQIDLNIVSTVPHSFGSSLKVQSTSTLRNFMSIYLTTNNMTEIYRKHHGRNKNQHIHCLIKILTILLWPSRRAIGRREAILFCNGSYFFKR